MRDGQSSCGLVETSTGSLREAAKLLINSSKGCDMKLTSEPRNLAYTEECLAYDHENIKHIHAAERLWGMEKP
jgi:hypothetical protein